MSSDSLSQREKSKQQYERELQELLTIPSNKLCADCGAKSTRWASFNLGVFLCIRCGGLHRRIGTHITRIKSTTLDSWNADQIKVMREWGNQKANAYYIPNPELYLIPSKNDNDMEVFIREKYEKKTFMNPVTCKSKFKIGAVVNEDPKLLEKYHLELWRLKDMGYINQDMSLYALKMFSGNILKASEWLTTQPGAKVTSALNTPRGSISDEPVVRFNGGIRQPSISSEGGPPSPTQNNFTFIPSSLPPISQGKEANQDFFGAFNGQTASVQQFQASFPQQAQAGFSQQSQGAFSQQTQQASAPQTDFFSMVSSNNSAFVNEPPVTSQQSRMQQQISTAPPVYKSRDELADVFSFDAKPAFVAVSTSAARKESVGPLAGLSGVFSESENAVKVNKKKDDILALFNAAPLQNNVQNAFAPQVANPFQTQPQQQQTYNPFSGQNSAFGQQVPFTQQSFYGGQQFATPMQQPQQNPFAPRAAQQSQMPFQQQNVFGNQPFGGQVVNNPFGQAQVNPFGQQQQQQQSSFF